MVIHPELPLLTFKAMEEISKFASYYCVHKEYLYVGVEAEAQVEYEGLVYDIELIESLGGFILPINLYRRLIVSGCG
jgi:hypothetical protein